MKRIISFFAALCLALAMLFSFTSCGDGREKIYVLSYGEYIGEGVIEAFLKANPAFRTVPFSLPGLPDAPEGMLHLFPHEIEGEGHFVAKLVRDMSVPDRRPFPVEKKARRGARGQRTGDKLPELPDIYRNLNLVGKHIYMDGRTLWALPDRIVPEQFRNLQVLRAGLALLDMGSRVPEPHHAAGMALTAEEAANVCQLTWDEMMAYQAGRRIMGLVEEGITARKIITPKSVRNAIKMDMAVAASSNLILHIPAIAHEAGYDEPWWKYFDEASNDIPLLAHIVPSGPRYSVHDLCLAGGMPALIKELLPKLDGDCLTVTGKTLAENVRDAKVYNRDVIHSLDRPVMKMPGIGVLYGNLAPEGAIVKIAAVPPRLMTFKGPARVFDELDDALDALKKGEIKTGDACVLRFLGLKGRFGTTAFTFQEMLKGRKELFESCAVITDGRFSGGSSGLSVGYVSPEAALMGPLGLIKDGDIITIDIPGRKIEVDAALESRKKDFSWKFDGSKYPRYLNLFVKNVGSMAHGGIWE